MEDDIDLGVFTAFFVLYYVIYARFIISFWYVEEEKTSYRDWKFTPSPLSCHFVLQNSYLTKQTEFVRWLSNITKQNEKEIQINDQPTEFYLTFIEI